MNEDLAGYQDIRSLGTWYVGKICLKRIPREIDDLDETKFRDIKEAGKIHIRQKKR